MQSPWLRSKQSIAESWLRREHRDRDLPLLPLPVLPEVQAAVHHQEAAQADVLLHQEAATAHGGDQAAHHQAAVQAHQVHSHHTVSRHIQAVLHQVIQATVHHQAHRATVHRATEVCRQPIQMGWYKLDKRC